MYATNTVVLGAQWGDEGKGKVVDLLAAYFKWVARYGGAHNAGHTVIVNGKTIVLHVIPSGILNGANCILGNGMLINPDAFLAEIAMLELKGVQKVRELVRISDRAHIITPWHSLIESVRTNSIGTTQRGVGPGYEDKAGRWGIRADVLGHESLLEAQLTKSCEMASREFQDAQHHQLPAMREEFVKQAKLLLPYICDTGHMLRQANKNGQGVLIEGAQGTMLDLDHGSYPFCTSSTCVSGGASTGLGIPPSSLGAVIGVTKAYNTRVGNGGFPTEIPETSVNGEYIIRVGKEKGSSTGRTRRPGWLDLFQLAYARDINGITALALTKGDILAGLGDIKVCTGYKLNGGLLESYPSLAENLAKCEPVYETLEGWENFYGETKFDKLPAAFRAYIEYIEDVLKIPVVIVSTGPERHQTIIRNDYSLHSLQWLDQIHVAA